MTTRENRRSIVATLSPAPSAQPRSREGLRRSPGEDAGAFTPRSTVEHREEARESCADPVWWRCERAREARVGWLLERSPGGAAFVMRDDLPPPKGAAIEIFAWLPGSADGRRGRLGFVRRVELVHDNLYLVAVQLFRYRTSTQDGLPPRSLRAALVEPYERPAKASGRARGGERGGRVTLEAKMKESRPLQGTQGGAPTLRFIPAPQGWAG